jgi:predicted transcriptional regulator
MKYEEGNAIKPYYKDGIDMNEGIRAKIAADLSYREEERKFFAKLLTNTEARVKSYGQMMQELAKSGVKDDEWKAELRQSLNHEKSMVKYYQDQIKMVTQLTRQEIPLPIMGAE